MRQKEATDGETTAWGALLDMKNYCYNVEEMDEGAVALIVDLVQSFRTNAAESGVGVGDALRLPQRILRMLC